MTDYHLFKGKSTLYSDKNILENDMPARTDWEDKARGLIRGEMAKRNISYSQLVELLESIGVQEDERNLRNKVSRGKFTAAFLLQCLSVLGAHSLTF